jgi:hypothetical protein
VDQPISITIEGAPPPRVHTSYPTHATPAPEPATLETISLPHEDTHMEHEIVPDILSRRSQRGYQPSLKHLEALQHTAHTAINVDTGALAEYHQLLRSSDGPFWEASACE